MVRPVTCNDADSQKRAKQAIRDRVRALRAARVDGPAQVGSALADVAVPHLHSSASVALYVSMRHEPDMWPLRTALRRCGVRVLLPWLREDGDLDWVLDVPDVPDVADVADVADVPDSARAADRRAALRPPGRLLGLDAVTAAQAVVVPALAVDTVGRRLGQGGGSYDRVLSRLAAEASRPQLIACVFDDEVRPAATDPLPEEPHDHRVDAALTPTRWLDFSASGR